MKIKTTTVFVALLFVSTFVFSQTKHTIAGKVLDEKGEPLPFATVLLGNGNGAVADFDGHFSVEIPADEESIEMTASSTGHAPQTTLWTNDRLGKPMKFWLKAGIELETIVVTYQSCLIVSDQLCSCQMIRKDEPRNWSLEIELLNLKKLEVYPNPFISTINLEMEVPTPQNYLFHLYNEAGQLVFAESRELEAGSQNFQLDLVQRHLPEGAYFLRISDDAGEIRTKRLVKVSP